MPPSEKEAFNAFKTKTRFHTDENGEITAHTKRERMPYNYKLSEKDHPLIIQRLREFVSLYKIALEIGCGYCTLQAYIKKHPELIETRKEASDCELDFVKGKLMEKINEGNLGAIMFYLERKGGWHAKQELDIQGLPMPNIVMGVIPEGELPDNQLGAPVQVAQIENLPPKDDSRILEREEEPDLVELNEQDVKVHKIAGYDEDVEDTSEEIEALDIFP